MDLSNQLFENPATGIDGILRQVWQIFAAHWPSLITITFLQIVSFAGTFLVLGLFTYVVAASYIVKVVKSIMDSMPDGTSDQWGPSRHLLDYSVGISGASRFLISSDGGVPYIPPEDGSGDNTDPNNMPEISAGFVIGTILLVLLWTVVLSLVSSTFAGAMNHAIAQIYTGCKPLPFESVKRGYAKKWNVYFYQLILSITVIALTFITLGAAPAMMYAGTMSVDDFGAIALGVVIYLISMVLIGTLTVAAIPAIVVEGKSALGGFLRSLGLCKKFICFIFCTELCFNFLAFIAMILFNLILSRLGFLGVIGHMFVNLSFATIAPIVQFVLYMSMRIQSERVVQGEFAEAMNCEEEVYSVPSAGDYTLVVDSEIVEDAAPVALPATVDEDVELQTQEEDTSPLRDEEVDFPNLLGSGDD